MTTVDEPRRNGFAWWPSRRGAVFDVVLAFSLAALPWTISLWLAPVLSTLTRVATPLSAQPDVVKLAAASAAGLALAARRRFPASVALVSLVVTGFGAGNTITLMVGVYTLAAYGTSRAVLAVFSLAAAVAWLKPWSWAGVPGGALGLEVTLAVVTVLTTVALPVVLGLYAAARRGLIANLRERADRLERERLLLTQQVRTEERTRIAREMHDVVAHRVSLMVVHAGALEMAPDKGPVKIAEAASRIADVGRQALGELRQIVGVLKIDRADEPAPLAPQPTLEDLAELVEQSRGAGVPVDVRVEGERRRLANVAERTAYRIVQEGLTNVHKHACGARTEISLRFLSDRLEVSVLNDRPPGRATMDLPSGGHGLAGLRERLTLVGGQFESGPSGDGGFRITARIPAR